MPRPWSDLGEAERERLLELYRATMADAPATCALDAKIARMNAFLEPHGVTLSEADLRRR